jgi:hypothetical protein
MSSWQHKCGTQMKILISFLSLPGLTKLDIFMLVKSLPNFELGKNCDVEMVEVIGHGNAAILLFF